MSQNLSRRELIRRGGVLGSLLAVPASVLGEGQAPGTPRSCCASLRRASARRGRLQVDRRAPAHQRPRHLHHHQRFDDAAGGAGGDGRGGAAVRPSRRARGSRRRAAGRAHRRRVGPRHQRLLRRADARHRGLRGWRQSGSARAPAEPQRLSRRTKPSSRPTRATSTTRRSARSACGSSKSRRSRSSRRRSDRAPRSSTSWPSPRVDESPLERQGDGADRQARRACRSSSMRPPRS